MAVVPVSHAPTTSMQKRGVNQVGLNRSYLIQKAAANSKIQKTKQAGRVSNDRSTSGAGARLPSNIQTGQRNVAQHQYMTETQKYSRPV